MICINVFPDCIVQKIKPDIVIIYMAWKWSALLNTFFNSDPPFQQVNQIVYGDVIVLNIFLKAIWMTLFLILPYLKKKIFEVQNDDKQQQCWTWIQIYLVNTTHRVISSWFVFVNVRIWNLNSGIYEKLYMETKQKTVPIIPCLQREWRKSLSGRVISALSF